MTQAPKFLILPIDPALPRTLQQTTKSSFQISLLIGTMDQFPWPQISVLSAFFALFQPTPGCTPFEFSLAISHLGCHFKSIRAL